MNQKTDYLQADWVGIFGHITDVHRRLKSRVEVSDKELVIAADEVAKLQNWLKNDWLSNLQQLRHDIFDKIQQSTHRQESERRQLISVEADTISVGEARELSSFDLAALEHLADVHQRIQSQVEVPDEELVRAENELNEMQDWVKDALDALEHLSQDLSEMNDFKRSLVVLGHLYDVERRLQSQIKVPDEELTEVENELKTLQNMSQQSGPQPTYDMAYKLWNDLLYKYPKETSLCRRATIPERWDFKKAMEEVKTKWDESRKMMEEMKRKWEQFRSTSTDDEYIESAFKRMSDEDILQKSMESVFEQMSNHAMLLDTVRAKQDSLHKQGLAYRDRGDLSTAAKFFREALDVWEKSNIDSADEQQQILSAGHGRYLQQQLIEIYLQQPDLAAALQTVERTKSQALLRVLGLTRLLRPSESSDLARLEEELLDKARQAVAFAWNSQDPYSRFRLWSSAIELRQKLEKVWRDMDQDHVHDWKEYVSLRRGTSLDMKEIRDCLR